MALRFCLVLMLGLSCTRAQSEDSPKAEPIYNCLHGFRQDSVTKHLHRDKNGHPEKCAPGDKVIESSAPRTVPVATSTPAPKAKKK